MNEWISVKDELPKINQDILVADNLKQVKASYLGVDILGVKYWHTVEQRYDFNSGFKRVTHWMPLPDPPEVENDAS